MLYYAGKYRQQTPQATMEKVLYSNMEKSENIQEAVTRLESSGQFRLSAGSGLKTNYLYQYAYKYNKIFL